MQDGGERGAGVFDVHINAAREQRLLADIGAGEIKRAGHGLVSARFEMLREDFSQQRLFREIFGADDDPRMAVGAAGGQQAENAKQRNN